MAKTLFDKIWDKHIVFQEIDSPAVLYIDTHLIHEVTSPQAFDGLRKRGIKVRRPDKTVATTDHNVPTVDQHLPIKEILSRKQVQTLVKNCEDFGIELYGLGHPFQGIVHVIGPELGITQPGKTIVCGDSHTSTHGAFGAIAFGIGTSEVEQVLATQSILQQKPKTMRITINGALKKGVSSKDIILYIISKIGTGGGAGYFVEYAGTTIQQLSMEARMTICNMSIEMGARGGLIAPDEITYSYLKDKQFAPKGDEWDLKLAYWKTLFSDDKASFDKEYEFAAADILPMITYGTNPAMGIHISEQIPTEIPVHSSEESYFKSLKYMGFEKGETMLDKPIDYVFIGSCTNARIEDLRLAAQIIKGQQKHSSTEVWVVPGSQQVMKQVKAEGLDKIFEAANIPIRQAGCSACLGMNEDKVPAGKYCISTSNRNFEGRQGPGSRTLLASPLTAAAAAITGKITDPRQFL